MTNRMEVAASPAHMVASPTPLTILLIGGSGFVGRQLAPALQRRGHVVRSASLSRSENAVADIKAEPWWPLVLDSDIILFLAVINNDVQATPATVARVNVDTPLKLLDILAEQGGGRSRKLILFGSDHAAEDAKSEYGRSKAALSNALSLRPGADAALLNLSPVHGEKFVKKLAFIDKMPFRKIWVNLFGSVRPLTHVDTIVQEIEFLAKSDSEQVVIKNISDNQDNNIIYNFITRLFDLTFAVTVLIVMGWLMAILSLVVWSSSPGPALFRQPRVGRNGRIFTCYKFRTMRVGTPQVATHTVSSDSTTAVGRKLRSLKLDELPQIFNIIKNDMSLVGPRPCLPSQEELITARKRLGVLGVKPGVTGWAQIQGIDMSDPEYLARSDAEYISRRSIPLYLSIVLKTFLGKGQGDKIR